MRGGEAGQGGARHRQHGRQVLRLRGQGHQGAANCGQLLPTIANYCQLYIAVPLQPVLHHLLLLVPRLLPAVAGGRQVRDVLLQVAGRGAAVSGHRCQQEEVPSVQVAKTITPVKYYLNLFKEIALLVIC